MGVLTTLAEQSTVRRRDRYCRQKFRDRH